VANSAESALRVRGLWELYTRSRDAQTREQLIEHYMPFAKIIAARLYGMRADPSSRFEDYLQLARVGLIEAVDRFDAGRNVSFESYSAHRIRGAILNGVGKESEVAAQRDFWRTRMPDRMHSVVAEVVGDPERASLADLIEITVAVALGLVLDEEQGEPIDETPHSNPYAATELEQLARLVKACVEELPEREREVIKGHYFHLLEFQAMAERYAITKGRVSQLHGRALLRLREMLDNRPRLDRKL
jgi:RNA polymerase sigma factor FliA